MFNRFSNALVDTKLYYDHFLKPMIEFKDHMDYYRSSINDAFMQDFQDFMRKFMPKSTPNKKSTKK